jgi:alginate O-acetyltransferase complex protein AlgI
MLFNSYPFLLAFLPITLLGFVVAGRFGKTFGAAWLGLCSLFFYAWWDYRYLPLLLSSVCVNYLAGGFIARHARTRQSKLAMAAAVAANLAVLAYYKYADFFLSSAMAVLHRDWPGLGIILPIGISFFTFTQIAFLVDAYEGKVKEYRFVNYLLFVTYFPHLIAGPVLHHKEMMPQFEEARTYRLNSANLAFGMSIFAIGLAKKVLLADNLAGYAAPVFMPQADAPSLFAAWGGVLAYTFQLYFDFSGYSDMAIGLSLLFGVRLPLNFNSPYKAINISDFWRRWHMTLSRFLRDYLYIPLGGNRHGEARRQLNLLTTMLLGGLWHGAGWNFVIWGGLHGVFLGIHNTWRSASQKLPWHLPARPARVLSVGLTFLCVVLAWVYFRAPNMATANRVLVGMVGGSGAGIPDVVMTHLGPLAPLLKGVGVSTYLGGGDSFVKMWLTVAGAALIAFTAPNTQEIMARALPGAPGQPEGQAPGRLTWMPRRRHAVLYGMLLGLGFLALSRPTEFLYFQF